MCKRRGTLCSYQRTLLPPPLTRNKQNETLITLKSFSYKNQKKPEKIQFSIAASACVWAGNDLLKSYALQFNPNVIRIPSTIDTERYRSVTKVQIEEVLTIGVEASLPSNISTRAFRPCLRSKRITETRRVMLLSATLSIAIPLWRS